MYARSKTTSSTPALRVLDGTTVPLVGLITDDPVLVQRLSQALAGRNARLVVAKDQLTAAEMLTSTAYMFRVVERASHRLPLPFDNCTGCPLVSAMGEATDLFLIGRDSLAACGGTRLYRRADLDALLEDLRHRLAPLEGTEPLAGILGETPAICLVRDQARSVARYRDVSVLILGETGTGKERVAQAIHELSHDGPRPFVAINCAAVPEQLFESELFGHEAGAYTGARASRRGLLEAAEDGTIFLDEIGEMPLSLQAKLLRVIETRTFRRVGSNTDLPLRARIISATNRGVAHDSTLRADLIYRLAGFTISLPPLRERSADVPELAYHFLRAFTDRHRAEPRTLSPAALEVLREHWWPGNVRELKSLIEHVAILARTTEISAGDVLTALSRSPQTGGPGAVLPTPPLLSAPASVAMVPPPPSSGRDAGPTSLRDVERDMILRAFNESGGNLSRAAKQLGIPRSTLRDKLRRYGAL